MALKVGSAVADFTFDLSPMRQQGEEIKRYVGDLQTQIRAAATAARGSAIAPGGNPSQAGAVRQAANEAIAQQRVAQAAQKVTIEQTKAAQTAAEQAAQAQAKLATEQARTAQIAQRSATEQARAQQQAAALATQAAQKQATEQARTARAATDAARAEQQLAKDTATAARAQDQAAITALKLEEARKKAARSGENGGLGPALPRTFAGFTPGGFNQALGAFGLATVGPQLVGSAITGAVDAGRSALELQKTDAGLRALAGSAKLYEEAIKAAREQQVLFGGSLTENIDGITGLVTVSRSAGVQLSTLIDLSQRLSVKDPAQGIAGARIALNEALSGDPTSLARRYEIPRAALAKLRDEGTTAAQKLQIIDGYLTKIGITSDAVGGSISDEAKAFNRFNAELGDLQTRAGALGVKTFAPAIEGANNLLKALQGDRDALAEIEAKSEKLRFQFGANGQLVSVQGSVSTDDVAAKRREIAANEVRDQFSRGENIALRQASQGDPVGNERAFTGAQARLAQLREQAVGLSAVSNETAQAVNALLEAFAQSGDTQKFADGLDLIANKLEFARVAQYSATRSAEDSVPGYLRAGQAQQEQARAAEDAAKALEAEREKMGASAAEAETARAKGEALALMQGRLKTAAEDAAKGSESIEHAAQRLALQFPVTVDEAKKLIGALRDLNAEGAKASTIDLKQQERQFEQAQKAQQGSQLPASAQAYLDQLKAGEEAATKARAAADARRRQIEQTGTAQQKLALAEQDYQQAVARGGRGSAEAIDAETALKRAREEAQRSRVSGSALTNNTIENQTADHYRRLVQLEQDYQRDIGRASEDYNTRRARDLEDFQRKQRKLLAEGKVFEARLAKEEFDRQRSRDDADFQTRQRRAAEDQATRVQRETDTAATRVDRTADRAALRGQKGINVPTLPGSGDVVPLAQPVPIITGQGQPGQATPGVPVLPALPTIQIQIAPQPINLDGQKIAEVVYPLIERRLADDLARTGVTAGPAPSNASGGRP